MILSGAGVGGSSSKRLTWQEMGTVLPEMCVDLERTVPPKLQGGKRKVVKAPLQASPHSVEALSSPGEAILHYWKTPYSPA